MTGRKGIGRRPKGIASCVGAWLLGLLSLGTAAGAWQAQAVKPRPLSDAERAAVEIGVAYLHGGPDALWQRLATDAPLRRLDRASAWQEILARLGPAEGTTWQLQTPGPRFDAQTAIFSVEYASGLDETLILRLVDQNGWKISEIRTSVDRVGRVEPAGVITAADAAPAPAAPDPATDSSGGLLAPPVLLRLCAGLLVLLLAAPGALLLARRGRHPASIGLAIGGAVAAGGLVAWGLLLPAPAPQVVQAAVQEVDAGFVLLGELAPLRAALAAGSDRAETDRLLAAPPADPALRDIHELWRAQYLLTEADLTTAETILGRFATPAPYPLADLLRARLAFRRLRRDDTGPAYEEAVSGLDHDGLRLESAIAKALTDDTAGAEIAISLIAEMGSRLSEAWYAAAQMAVGEGQIETAEAYLRHAWQLEPAPREELLDEPVLAFLVIRPGLFPLFQLGAAEEPSVASERPRRSLTGPAGMTAATCGESLRLAIGEAEMLVPGGAELAPPDAPLENADGWSRHAEAKALAALPMLTASATAGETLPPRRLRLAEEAGRALAAQNRWDELIALTETLSVDLARAPSILVRLRAQALRKRERDEEARQLLIRLAGSDLADRRPAPGTLFELAELFAASGEYDTAIKLSLKADSQLPQPRGERRRRQLEMEKELAASYSSYRTDHFEVRFPRETGETYARGVAQVLEAERRRLQRWIPQPAATPRIEVHLFPIQQFVNNFGGDIAVVGIFDGKVRVPFAELRSLHPELVQILSHELAHAMIAAATRDQAPHWLQEGLAEHVEMGLGRLNPLPDLARTGRALSFPTVEPILSGFAEAQLVDLAYAEAAWTVHFIEARFGEKAIHRLLAAFAAGKTTEQALRDVCGLSPAEFDRALWEWGTRKAPQTRNLQVRRYDAEYAYQVVQEQKAEIPRVGRVEKASEEDGERLRDEEAERRRRMETWYAKYTARTASVKRALKPVIDAYQGEAATPTGTAAACTELMTEVSKALGELPVWASPDGNVNRTLRTAYQTLANVGKSCKAGRDTETRVLINRASQSLSDAARYLEPYGLSP